MAVWQTFEVQVPGKDLLEPARNALETLVVMLDALKAILETIKLFLVDFGNPVRALAEALIRLIEELFFSLKASGVGALYVLPDPITDPGMQLNQGYGSFVQTFKQSLLDSKDLNRPQPRPGSNTGGFVLLMVQSDSPYDLLSKVQRLLSFFSKEFSSPRLESPRNFKVTPVGTSGDPILAVAQLFKQSPIKTIELSWASPTSSETPDTSFNDLVSRAAAEFVPVQYLIEKSVINPVAEALEEQFLRDPTKAGKVTYNYEQFVAGTNVPVARKDFLRDNNGEPVIKFTKYIVVDAISVTSALGLLGTYRYLDSDIIPDMTYYYRVRALNGELTLTTDDQIEWGSPRNLDSQYAKAVRWPGEDVVVGKPTGIVSALVPQAFPTFDVVENIRKLFLAAYSMDFHVQHEWESPGNGILTNHAGVVYFSEYYPLYITLGEGVNSISSLVERQAKHGPIILPWEEVKVRQQSARMADAIAASLLAVGTPALSQFQSLMQSPTLLLGQNTLEAAVSDHVKGGDKVDLQKKVERFETAFGDDPYRKAVAGAIDMLLSYRGAGASPDWITVNPLRDIIPWSGQILYELLAKIQSLVDAYSGTITEIKNFIDLLERKIDTLERSLQFLISILDLIESFQLGAYMLAVPSVSGGPLDWIAEVDNAIGAPPLTMGKGGYSAGTAFAYVAPDVAAFQTAFSLIFGV